MGSVERTRELRRRRSRKVKLKKLRGRFAKAANETEKAAILAKARRVVFRVLNYHPHLTTFFRLAETLRC